MRLRQKLKNSKPTDVGLLFFHNDSVRCNGRFLRESPLPLLSLAYCLRKLHIKYIQIKPSLDCQNSRAVQRAFYVWEEESTWN